MSILPNTKSALLDFCASHAKTWGAAPTSVGLTSAECDLLDTAVETATQTAADLITARDVARAATLADNNASQTMRAIAGALIAKIKATAEVTNNPNIYVLAQIPAPSGPGPSEPPVQPTNLKVALEPSGALTLKWKTAANPLGGVVYQVYRKLPTQTTFSLIGTAGGRSKSFTDTSLPVNTSGVMYVVQGQRGSETGPQSEILTVTFGSVAGGGGGMQFTLTPHAEPVKIAA